MAGRWLLYGSERYALAILRPLQEAIRARGDEAAWFFDRTGADDLRPDEPLLRSTQEVQRWNPAAILSPSNALPHFFPGAKVGLFHGFNAGKPRHIYIRGFFDLYCTSGPDDTQAFQALADRLGHFEVRETGWPKLDPFFRTLGSAPAPPHNPPVVLYHSTFSPSWSAAGILHDTVKRLSASGRWRWIVTFHPKMDPAVVARYRALEGPFLRFATDDNIHDLFPQVDVMVSDTSSALHEFTLTRKPVVTFRTLKPGPHFIDIAEPALLEPSIERALARPPDLMKSIAAYADHIHPQRDGHSSERVLAAVDDFIARGAKTRRPKPWNLWRKLKLRKRLGYWGR